MTATKITDLAEAVGDFIGYWGFRKIHGRLWTLIYLSKEPVSTLELIESLGYSKGLISVALKELTDFDLVKCVGKKAGGIQLYEANPNVLSVIVSILQSRELSMLNKASSAIAGLSKKATLRSDRLEDLAQMIQTSKGLLQLLTSQNKDTLSEWIKIIGLKG